MNNWEEIRQRKEDSIRESTGNPMSKPFKINGKTYNSYTEWSNSDEHKELLQIEEQVREQYKQKAKEYYDSLETDNQLLLFFYITNVIFENYFKIMVHIEACYMINLVLVLKLTV